MKTTVQYILHKHQDTNNLHGWEMIQYLPTEGFKWLPYDEINKFDVNAIQQDSEEDKNSDLRYPETLHDLHNGYLVTPKKIQVREDMLSNYCEKLLNEHIFSNGKNHQFIAKLYHIPYPFSNLD